MMSTPCPFCPPELDEDRVKDSNDVCLFLVTREPILGGSGVIVPRAHRTDVFELSQEEWLATFELLARVKKTIDRELAPNGWNVGWNCGATAGQEVLHAHMHVIPRFADEPLAGKGIRHWLKQDVNRRTDRPSPVISGNAVEASRNTRGWFLGHFMPADHPLRSEDVEIKWYTHAKGETREQWAPPNAVRTLNVLIRGKFVLLFPDREVTLGKEGDFVLFGPGIAHSFRSVEESLVLTVRWPSRP
jgi:diadenosine tetraphosphate (Ap4A) HIT family hydrolase